MLKTHGLVQWWVYEIYTLYEYITYRNAMKSILNIDIISTSMQNIGQIPAGVWSDPGRPPKVLIFHGEIHEIS